MKCAICKHAATEEGTTTITLERHSLTLVVKGVPAQVCPNCGEAYVDEYVVSRLLAEAEQLAEAGVQVEIRGYAGESGNGN